MPERPISDPLLRADSAPRRALGAPVRAPMGNSIKTFIAFVLLALVGVAIWWIRRPDDLSSSIGGREWVITDVDGEPATNGAGLVSTFVLDGTGEIRGPVGCNVASGAWTYDGRTSELSIDWRTQTQLLCPEDWPTTYLPDGGEVSIDGAVMRIETDTGELRAVALVDRSPATVDEIAGSWASGGEVVEIGRRGRFQLGECSGSWEPAAGDDELMRIRFEELQRDDCDLASIWRDETPVVPVVDAGSVYLRRDRTIFPIDRAIVRLDPEA